MDDVLFLYAIKAGFRGAAVIVGEELVGLVRFTTILFVTFAAFATSVIDALINPEKIITKHSAATLNALIARYLI